MTKQVWAIHYAVRANSHATWSSWTGPCGVGLVWKGMRDSFLYNSLSGRPFFFRTRALARLHAKALARESNITWEWVKYTVRPFTLTWTERN